MRDKETTCLQSTNNDSYLLQRENKFDLQYRNSGDNTLCNLAINLWCEITMRLQVDYNVIGMPERSDKWD